MPSATPAETAKKLLERQKRNETSAALHLKGKSTTTEVTEAQNGNNDKTTADSPTSRRSTRKVTEGVSETDNLEKPRKKGKRSSKQQHATVLGTQSELEDVVIGQENVSVMGIQNELENITSTTKVEESEKKDDEVVHEDLVEDESGKDGTEDGSMYNGEEDDDEEEDTDEDANEDKKVRKRKKSEDTSRITACNASQSSSETNAQDEDGTPR